MPKAPAVSRKSELARSDRETVLARREASLRVEELKLKLQLLTDKHFDQSLNIIKRWMRDDGKEADRRS